MRDMSNSGYALLVGVNDYGAYDRSEGNAPGTSDLRGSLNDVRAWLATCLEIGIPRENIRVLSSPAASTAELGGAQGGPATAAAIREGVQWLAEKLKAAAQPVGVLLFSGHGDLTKNDGLVICPSDVTASGDDLVNDVSLAWMQGALGGLQNLTVVLDCCHSGGGMAAGSSKLTSLRGRAWPSDPAAHPALPAMPAIGDRMFFAARRGQSAYQAEFMSDQVYGAFTWAFMTVKSQWTMAQDGGTRVLTISYGEMQKRALMLLDALSFGQTPELQCAENVVGLPLFNPGEAGRGIACEVDPDAKRTGIQCDPGDREHYRIYTFSCQESTSISTVPIAYVLVSRRAITLNGVSIKENTEYWFLTADFENATGGSTLTIAWDSCELPSAVSESTLPAISSSESEILAKIIKQNNGICFTTSAEASWSSGIVVGSSERVYTHSDDASDSSRLNFGISFGGSKDSPTITWYVPEKPSGSYVLGTGAPNGELTLSNDTGAIPNWPTNSPLTCNRAMEAAPTFDDQWLWSMTSNPYQNNFVLTPSRDGQTWLNDWTITLPIYPIANAVTFANTICIVSSWRSVKVICSSNIWSLLEAAKSPKLSIDCYGGNNSTAVFKDNFYFAHNNAGDTGIVSSLSLAEIKCSTSLDENNLSTSFPLGGMSCCNIGGLAVLNGKLYAAIAIWLGELNWKFQTVWTSDGNDWSSESMVSTEKFTGRGLNCPALVAFKDKLYMMLIVPDPESDLVSQVVILSSEDGAKWVTSQTLSITIEVDQTFGGMIINMVAFQDNLILACTGVYWDVAVWVRTSDDGLSWSNPVETKSLNGLIAFVTPYPQKA